MQYNTIHPRKKERMENEIVMALCCLIFLPAINNFINCIFQTGLSIPTTFLTPVTYIAMAFISVFFLYKYIFHNGAMLLFAFVILVGSLISYFRYPDIRKALYDSPVDLVYSPLNKLFYFCIPAMAGAAKLSDYSKLLKAMKRWSRITIIIGIVAFVFVMLIRGRTMQYMVYSYFMLIPICSSFVSANYQERAKRTDIVLGIIGGLCIVACGARGAVLSLIMFFIVLWVSLFREKLTARSLFVLLTVVIGVALCLLYYEEIVTGLADFFERNGIKSRFLSSLLDDTILEDDSRENISDTLMKAIAKNPWGYGFYGDRYATLEFQRQMYYAHNIFLEIPCHLGVIIGPLVLIFFGWRMVKTLYNRPELNIHKIIIILMPYGFFQLFFSSSYLECPPFFMLIGFFFFNKHARIHKMNNNRGLQ